MSYFDIFVNYLSKFWYIVAAWFQFCIIGIIFHVHDLSEKSQNQIELEDRSGYVAVVTGGSRGIGCHVVKMLMQCNMHVIIGCRDVNKGVNFVSKLRKDGMNKGSASVYHLDLASLKSVQKFAQEVIENHQQVNVLVNNAGIISGRNVYEETEDGIEKHLAVNYLGHFLLTILLLPLMNKISNFPTSSPRIVNVSSVSTYAYPKIDFTKWDDRFQNGFTFIKAYGRSKTCQIMSTKYLQKYLDSIDSSVDILSVHPGVVNTNIFDISIIVTYIHRVLPSKILKKPEDGATPIVYTCISKDFNKKGGLYINNNRRIGKHHKCLNNENDQEILYQLSMKSVQKYISHDNPIFNN